VELDVIQILMQNNQHMDVSTITELQTLKDTFSMSYFNTPVYS
jgi:hypothetical protein